MLRDRVAVAPRPGPTTATSAAAVAILNHKREAGASLPHPHAQVLATDFVPPAIAAAVGARRARIDGSRARRPRPQRDVGARDAIDGDACGARSRRARRSSCASRACRRARDFDRAPHDEIAAVAARDTRRARRARAHARRPAVQRGDPQRATVGAHTFHWYVEITPRVAVVAGFEQATGLFVNTVDPAQAARTLHEAATVITIRVCTTIAAPPDEVWAAVEHIEHHIEWMQDAESITFRSEQHAGVGAEFDCLTRVGPLHTTDHFVVTVWEPGVAMGIEHRGAVTGDGEFRLYRVGRRRHALLLGGAAAVPVVARQRRGRAGGQAGAAAALAGQPRPAEGADRRRLTVADADGALATLGVASRMRDPGVASATCRLPSCGRRGSDLRLDRTTAVGPSGRQQLKRAVGRTAGNPASSGCDRPCRVDRRHNDVTVVPSISLAEYSIELYDAPITGKPPLARCAPGREDRPREEREGRRRDHQARTTAHPEGAGRR